MKELLVIIPAYNEEANIANVIEEIRVDLEFADILVVNDCSTDRTEEILIKKNVDYINTTFNFGYAGGVQTGFKYADVNDYNYVAQFDGDGQHIAKELKKMYNLMIEQDVDIVIGSRFKSETEYNHSFFRKIGTNIFQNIIKNVCKKEITDPTSGMQLLNKKVYKHYAKMYNYPDYPDANLIIEMLFKGIEVTEIPVEMRERIAGVSMHAGVWGPIKYMIKMFYSIIVIISKYKFDNKIMERGEILD